MYCEHCYEQENKYVPVHGFCVDCVTFFCATCLRYHQTFLPDHVQQEKNSMPTDVCLNRCEQHSDKLVKFYCHSCEEAACIICKTALHGTCKEVHHLQKLALEIDRVKEWSAIKNCLDLLEKEVAKIEVHLNNGKSNVRKYQVEAVSELRKQRDCMENIFNNLEKEIGKNHAANMNFLESAENSKNILKTEINNLKTESEKLMNSPPKIMIFFKSKAIKKEREQIKEQLAALNTKLKQEICKYKYTPAGQKLKMESFGKVMIEPKNTKKLFKVQWCQVLFVLALSLIFGGFLFNENTHIMVYNFLDIKSCDIKHTDTPTDISKEYGDIKRVDSLSNMEKSDDIKQVEKLCDMKISDGIKQVDILQDNEISDDIKQVDKPSNVEDSDDLQKINKLSKTKVSDDIKQINTISDIKVSDSIKQVHTSGIIESDGMEQMGKVLDIEVPGKIKKVDKILDIDVTGNIKQEGKVLDIEVSGNIKQVDKSLVIEEPGNIKQMNKVLDIEVPGKIKQVDKVLDIKVSHNIEQMDKESDIEVPGNIKHVDKVFDIEVSDDIKQVVKLSDIEVSYFIKQICYLSQYSLLIVDINEIVHVYNPLDNTWTNKFHRAQLTDISRVQHDMVAATFTGNAEVWSIFCSKSQFSMKILEKVNVGNNCKFTQYRAKKIYVMCQEIIKIYDENQNELNSFKTGILSSQGMIVSPNGRTIYVSSLIDESIVMYATDGKVLNQYKNKAIGPVKMTMDSSGNLFVCGCYPYNIFYITADLKYGYEILNESHGLNEKPDSITYNERDNILYISFDGSTSIQAFRIKTPRLQHSLLT